MDRTDGIMDAILNVYQFGSPYLKASCIDGYMWSIASDDLSTCSISFVFFFQAEDGIRDYKVTGVQTCALPILFRGWALESRVGAEAQGRLKILQDDAEAARKKLEPYYPFIHGVKDSEKPANIQIGRASCRERV